MHRRVRGTALLLALCLLLTGCGGSAGQAETEAPTRAFTPATAPAEQSSEPLPPYEAPELALSAFHPELAEGNSVARVDLSAVSEGYVAVSAVSETRLKFQVMKDDLTYTYDLSSDGTPSIFPLQCGNGYYTFRVMENVGESKYAQRYLTDCEVELLDEFQPFLRPSDYADYDADSACVQKAAQLAASCSNKLELVSAVYAFVTENIRYDSGKASSVQSGYLPNPDETLETGKGICFDYAALAASMLRSQGIPTKLIFGYVSPDNLYHAWNMFYTEESGWVTVSFEVDGKTWTRIDLTFSAGGAPDEFVGDGSHYAEVYSY